MVEEGEGVMQVAEQQNGLKQRGETEKGGRIFTSTTMLLESKKE